MTGQASLGSWGRYPPVRQNRRALAPGVDSFSPRAERVLAFGNGRSYGDVCLNDGGTPVSYTHLDVYKRQRSRSRPEEQ